MRVFSPLDLLLAHDWRRALFTTYSLSLALFESVVLEALTRGGGARIDILSDVVGVRSALGEVGARQVGRAYDLHPVLVERGVFHPKLGVLTSAEEAHIFVGSANLTFGGWGVNLEAVDHLHLGFAGQAFLDAADFLESLASAPHVRHTAEAACLDQAADLKRRAPQEGGGSVRLLHNLDRALTDQIVELCSDLGPAKRLTAAAPFWDGGAALDDLAQALGLDHAYVHAHPGGAVHGQLGSGWPDAARTRIQPSTIELLTAGGSNRRLHAKLFEVVGQRGRLVVSGSPNATTAALGRRRNVELAVVRVQRALRTGWRLFPAEVPAAVEGSAAPSDEVEVGVLQAACQGDRVIGRVLTRVGEPRAVAYRHSAEEVVALGHVRLDRDGSFDLLAPGMEQLTWSGVRLTLRLEGGDWTAEGFISFVDFATVARRAGAIGPKLFALLAGNETPADVAAIMSWFYDNPERLARTGGPGWSGAELPEDGNGFVTGTELLSWWSLDAGSAAGSGQPAKWSRFMTQVFAALSQTRPVWHPNEADDAREEDEGDEENAPAAAFEEAAVTRALCVFDRLFNAVVPHATDADILGTMFRLTNYVCARLSPDPETADDYLSQLLEAFGRTPPREEDLTRVAAAVCTALAADGKVARARRRLRRLGWDLRSGPPDLQGAGGFGREVARTYDWKAIVDARLPQEHVLAFVAELQSPTGSFHSTYLQLAPEWPILREALTSNRRRDRVQVLAKFGESCPRCHQALPRQEVHRLRSTAIAVARNCCDRVLLCTEI